VRAYKSVDGIRIASSAAKDYAMKFRQTMLSLTAFALVVGGLVYVDPRVLGRFTQMVSGEEGVSSWDNRLVDLGGALISAIRYQSLENAPLMIFAVVGAVLFLFMVRT
jgi:hypothetical protein